MKKIISLMLSLAMLCTMGVTAFAEDATITDQSDPQSSPCEVIYDLDTEYCIVIPQQIHASDGGYTFYANHVYLHDNEQVAVYISPMTEQGMITLQSEKGNTLNMCVYYNHDGLKELSENGLVAVFTDSPISNGSVLFEKVIDGASRNAGEYYGTFEFTIRIENRA